MADPEHWPATHTHTLARADSHVDGCVSKIFTPNGTLVSGNMDRRCLNFDPYPYVGRHIVLGPFESCPVPPRNKEQSWPLMSGMRGFPKRCPAQTEPKANPGKKKTQDGHFQTHAHLQRSGPQMNAPTVASTWD